MQRITNIDVCNDNKLYLLGVLQGFSTTNTIRKTKLYNDTELRFLPPLILYAACTFEIKLNYDALEYHAISKSFTMKQNHEIFDYTHRTANVCSDTTLWLFQLLHKRCPR